MFLNSWEFNRDQTWPAVKPIDQLNCESRTVDYVLTCWCCYDSAAAVSSTQYNQCSWSDTSSPNSRHHYHVCTIFHHRRAFSL